jgi:hypothetical protein
MPLSGNIACTATRPRITKEVVGIYKGVMVYAAYMMGHIDGIDGNVTASAPKAIDTLERNPYFKPR